MSYFSEKINIKHSSICRCTLCRCFTPTPINFTKIVLRVRLKIYVFGQPSKFISLAVKLSCSQPLRCTILCLSRLFYKDSSTVSLSSIPIWIRLGCKKFVVFAHVRLHKITQRVNRLSRHPNTTPTFLNPLRPSSLHLSLH